MCIHRLCSSTAVFFLWIYCLGYMDGNSSRHENEHEAGARRCHIQRTPVGEKLAALNKPRLRKWDTLLVLA